MERMSASGTAPHERASHPYLPIAAIIALPRLPISRQNRLRRCEKQIIGVAQASVPPRQRAIQRRRRRGARNVWDTRSDAKRSQKVLDLFYVKFRAADS